MSSRPAASPDSALTSLLSQASARNPHQLPYAGDVMPEEAYAYLQSHRGVLLDVRTPSEWRAGMPDLKGAEGECRAISWKINTNETMDGVPANACSLASLGTPNYQVNPRFADQVATEQSITKDTPLFFMCKGGGRSLEAAQAMAAQGYRYCFNIRGGFEGRPDVPGWKARQLPCKQG